MVEKVPVKKGIGLINVKVVLDKYGEHIGGDVGGQHEPPGGGCHPELEVPCRKGAGRVHDVPGGLRLNEEETVILLSNLLDNAIHECVKVVRQERKVIIHVKLVQEGGKLIFSVRNPVAEKAEVML